RDAAPAATRPHPCAVAYDAADHRRRSSCRLLSGDDGIEMRAGRIEHWFLLLECVGRRAGADQVTVTVGLIDARHRWPVLVGVEARGERCNLLRVATVPVRRQR